ncbi:hypothetical protein E6W39_34490 [Kitasatospora acidiphila]|uniref:RNA polymerase sigma-70 region 2 domain-containing protein n=1 Tax=Kitasatospora acidiphila TaxID=2567942 RepID=A0A540WBR1_9ACTN|nr:sigma factor [Kitasatospora acidiphila]TQF06392.1 hypothetical protein E6W39_34490 [Kitasatospora acidiphila]
MTVVDEVIVRAHREEWARVVAVLARRFGDLDVAEEMAAEAFASAVERWPVDGVPANPGAWLTTTAHRKAIDRLRREARREEKQREALLLSDTPEPLGTIDDDRLRLVFTCCHPALAMEARVALTLWMVGGLTVPEIARAFLVDGPDVALADIDDLPLAGYHAFHATRADLLRRLGRSEESRAAYDRAIALAGNTAETAYLTRRRDQL